MATMIQQLLSRQSRGHSSRPDIPPTRIRENILWGESTYQCCGHERHGTDSMAPTERDPILRMLSLIFSAISWVTSKHFHRTCPR